MTTRDDAAAATTWEEWVASQVVGSAGQYAARVHPLPYALDWRRNPDAPPPPGCVWARCLCGVRPIREATWRRYRAICGWRLDDDPDTGERRWTGCAAPFVRVARPGDPYPPVNIDNPRGHPTGPRTGFPLDQEE